MTSSSRLVVQEKRDNILLVTINRPEVRNAFNAEATRQMSEAMDRLDSDPQLYLGIITGANGYFSAGADLKAAKSGEKRSLNERGHFGICQKRPAKPIIAAVEGFALGGGFEIVLACDLIVAARNARLGLPEVKRNLVAMAGGLLRLPRRIPYHLAMELALTGEAREADQFVNYGLINRLTEPGKALEQAFNLAEEVLKNGPTALAATTEIIRQTHDGPAEIAWALQRSLATPALQSEDRQEGIRAFLEKRTPVWKGK